ncbi:hypothetical protein DFA_02318 [Cavenderia fasciculata]|uniref:Uncharacterized protein n=1 Tax=Cavenderia fasciculata TaxID=261658 RepID=F4PZ45_CACFS|nr:uncharacterized protein DFA_02318 [Cavenderia fasciculata]EGG19074.1 hypothetical protein DFA_02318 [Cavenderia fasciculata]|eukprot:XP_004366707.1 hypothetical protein DFA_02318 [Cavenderia fasciculata]
MICNDDEYNHQPTIIILLYVTLVSHYFSIDVLIVGKRDREMFKRDNDNDDIITSSYEYLPLILQRKIIYYCWCLKWENRYLYSKKQKLELAIVSWNWFNMSSNVFLEVSEVCFKPMKDDIVEMYSHMSSRYCLIKSFNHLFIYDDYHYGTHSRFPDTSKDMITFRHHRQANQVPLEWFQTQCYTTLNHLTIYVLGFCPADHLLGSLSILMDLLINYPGNKLPDVITIRQRSEWVRPTFQEGGKVLQAHDVMNHIRLLTTRATKIDCECHATQNQNAYSNRRQSLKPEHDQLPIAMTNFFSSKTLTDLSLVECQSEWQYDIISNLPISLKRLSLQFGNIQPSVLSSLTRFQLLEYFFAPSFNWQQTDDYSRQFLDVVNNLPNIKVFSVNRVSVSRATNLSALFHKAIAKPSITSIGLEMDNVEYGDPLLISNSIQNLRIYFAYDIKYSWDDQRKWNLFTNQFTNLQSLLLESKLLLNNQNFSQLSTILNNCQSLLTLAVVECWATLQEEVDENDENNNIHLEEVAEKYSQPDDERVQSRGDITQKSMIELFSTILYHPTLLNFEIDTQPSRQHMYRCLLDKDYDKNTRLQLVPMYKELMGSIHQSYIITFKSTTSNLKIKCTNTTNIPTTLLTEMKQLLPKSKLKYDTTIQPNLNRQIINNNNQNNNQKNNNNLKGKQYKKVGCVVLYGGHICCWSDMFDESTATQYNLNSFQDILKNSTISDQHVLHPRQTNNNDYPMWIQDRICTSLRKDPSSITTVLLEN